MREVGLGLLKAKRLNPLELFGGHGCKDRQGHRRRCCAKAQEIEDRKRKALRRR